MRPKPVEQHERIGVMAKVGVGPDWVVKSFIWLEALKEADRSRAVLPDLVASLSFEIGSVPEARELDILERIGLATGATDDKQVQGGPSVLNYITNDCAPSEWNRFARIQDEMSNAIRVHMNPKFVRVTRNEGVHLSIELCEVFLCPFYFGAGSDPTIRLTGTHAVPSVRGIRIPLYRSKRWRIVDLGVSSGAISGLIGEALALCSDNRLGRAILDRLGLSTTQLPVHHTLEVQRQGGVAR